MTSYSSIVRKTSPPRNSTKATTNEGPQNGLLIQKNYCDRTNGVKSSNIRLIDSSLAGGNVNKRAENGSHQTKTPSLVSTDDRPTDCGGRNSQIVHTLQATHTIVSNYTQSYFLQSNEQTQPYFNDLEEFPRLGASKPRKRSTSESYSKGSPNEGFFATSELSPYAAPFMFRGSPYRSSNNNNFNNCDYQNGVEAYDVARSRPPKLIADTEDIRDNDGNYPEYTTDFNCASISLSRQKYISKLSADAKPFEFKKSNTNGEVKNEYQSKNCKIGESIGSPKRFPSLDIQPFVPRKYEQIDFRSAISFSRNPKRENSPNDSHYERKNSPDDSEKNTLHSWRRATPDTDSPKFKRQNSTTDQSESAGNRPQKTAFSDFAKASYGSLSDLRDESREASLNDKGSDEEESVKKKYPLMSLPLSSSNDAKQKCMTLRADATPFIFSKTNGTTIEKAQNNIPNISVGNFQKSYKAVNGCGATSNANSFATHQVEENEESSARHVKSSGINKTASKAGTQKENEVVEFIPRKAEKTELLADNCNEFDSNSPVWRRSPLPTPVLNNGKVPFTGNSSLNTRSGPASQLNNYCAWSEPNNGRSKAIPLQIDANKTEYLLSPAAFPFIPKTILHDNMLTAHGDPCKNDKSLKMNENNYVKPFEQAVRPNHFEKIALTRPMEQHMSASQSAQAIFTSKPQLSDSSANRSFATEAHIKQEQQRTGSIKACAPVAVDRRHPANSNTLVQGYSRDGMSIENSARDQNGHRTNVRVPDLPRISAQFSMVTLRDDLSRKSITENSILPLPKDDCQRDSGNVFEQGTHSTDAASRSMGEWYKHQQISYKKNSAHDPENHDANCNSMEFVHARKASIPERTDVYQQSGCVDIVPRIVRAVERQDDDLAFARKKTSACTADTSYSNKFIYNVNPNRPALEMNYSSWNYTNPTNGDDEKLRRDIAREQVEQKNKGNWPHVRRFNASNNILNLIHADAMAKARTHPEYVRTKPTYGHNYQEMESARVQSVDLNRTPEQNVAGKNSYLSARIEVHSKNHIEVDQLNPSASKASPTEIFKTSNRSLLPKKDLSAAIIRRPATPPPVPPRRRVPTCQPGTGSLSTTPLSIAAEVEKGVTLCEKNVFLSDKPNTVMYGGAESAEDASKHWKHPPANGKNPQSSEQDRGKENLKLLSMSQESKFLPTQIAAPKLNLAHAVAMSPRPSTGTNPFLDDYIDEDDSSGTTVAAPNIQSIRDPLKDPLWEYIAPNNQIQGPFTSIEMAEWFNVGYFEEDLKIRRNCDERFLTIEEFIKLTGSSSPFLESRSVPPLKVEQSIVSRFTNPFHEYLKSKV